MDSIMAIDYTTPVGQTRLLATDITEPYIFTDDAINAFLSLTNGNVKRAAALALLAIAADEALVIKKIRTDDLQVDGPAVAEQLRKQAADLNDQADNDDARELNDDFLLVFDNHRAFVPEATLPPVYGRVMEWARWR